MIHQPVVAFSVALVLILNVGQCQGQEPAIVVTTSGITLKSEDTFELNCTVTTYGKNWVTEIVKTKFTVNTPKGTKFELTTGGWPYSIAKNEAVDPDLKAAEGTRYSATHIEVDQNTTRTSVMVSSTKPEDSGVWACRVRDADANTIVNNETYSVNLQVDGPIRSMKIFAEVMPGAPVPANKTLSDGVAYTFMDGVPTRLTCEVGVPSSTGPEIEIERTDADGEETELTDDFDETTERSTSGMPKAGGLVRHTAHVAKVNNKFTPDIANHGSVIGCEAEVKGYKEVNASFTLNVEGPPRITCPSQIAAPIDSTNIKIECTILANPPVAAAAWAIPDAVSHMTDNATATNTLTGIKLKSTLNIMHVTKGHYGKYNVTASNAHGTASKIVSLDDKTISEGPKATCSYVVVTLCSLILTVVFQR